MGRPERTSAERGGGKDLADVRKLGLFYSSTLYRHSLWLSLSINCCCQSCTICATEYNMGLHAKPITHVLLSVDMTHISAHLGYGKCDDDDEINKQPIFTAPAIVLSVRPWSSVTC